MKKYIPYNDISYLLVNIMVFWVIEGTYNKKKGVLMKKILMGILVIALCMTFMAGCKEKEKAVVSEVQTTVASKEIKKVHLQLSIWGNDTHKAMYEELLAKYTEENPNVTVEVLTIPFSEYQQKISILKAGGATPDVLWLADVMIAQFLNTDQLTDISALQTDKDYNFGDINKNLLEPVTKDGKYYGVPFSTPPSLLYYNKTMFEKNNIPTPTELYKAGNWNFETFLSSAKAISDKNTGTYGVIMNKGNWKKWYFSVADFVWGFGGDVFNKDGTEFTLNSEAGRKGVQMFYDMIFTNEVHPKPGDQTTFESGKIGMFSDTLAYIKTASAITDFEWDIIPMPAGPESTNVRTGFAAYVMFDEEDQSDSYKAEKLNLFKYLTSEEVMSVTAKFFVPPRESVIASKDFIDLYPENIRDSFKITILDPLENARVPVTPENYTKIDSEIIRYFDMMYTKSATVDEALNQMEKAVVPLMKK
jgi:multiple sugar transport system substrate-binding protein